MWGGITVVLPYELFVVTGDLRMLKSAYSTARTYLNFMWHYSGNGTQLLTPDGFDFLGDWQSPHGCGSSADSSLYNNAYFVYVLKLGAKVARIVGAPAEDVARFAAAAAAIGTITHSSFYDSSKKRYAAGGNSYQGHQVLPLVAGLVPETLVSTVLASLVDQIVVEKQNHVDTGLHTTYFMAKLLSTPAVARDDLLLAMATNPTAPSYAWLVLQNLTTWPETWSIKPVAGAASLMHGTLNGFSLWFPQSLVGVRADHDDPGFQAFTIQPAYASGIHAANGTAATPYGPVAVQWTIAPEGVESGSFQKEVFTLALSIPFNTVAKVWIPARSERDVMEGGKPASQQQCTFLRQDGGNTVWQLGAGTYSFAVSS